MGQNTVGERMLPYRIPCTETYQGIAFVLGILLECENVREEYYNRYVNLTCCKTDDLRKLELKPYNVEWEDFRTSGIAEMDLYHLENIEKTKCAGFLRERIDQGNYLLLYSIDEYYLSYSDSYLKEHVKHDTYIRGYKGNEFCVIAYSNKKLRMLTVPEKEIVDALYARMELDPETDFCSFRICESIERQRDYSLFCDELAEYMRGEVRDEVLGVEVYSVLLDCLKKCLDDNDKELDLRALRMLWEHKKMLLDHLYVFRNCSEKIELIIPKIEEVERIAHLVFFLSIKYNLSHDREVGKRIIEYVKMIRDNERRSIQCLQI